MRQSLIHHPATPCPVLRQINAEISRPAIDQLRLIYLLAGDVSALRIPEAAPSERVDELWRHTCCELFIGGEGDAYYEFNFSLSTAWAAYHFTSYRSGMKDAVLAKAPAIEVGRTKSNLEVSVVLSLAGLSDLQVDVEWRAGLSAVIEEAGGAKSYWALRHPPGKPDFHHADCFALQISAKEGA